NLNSGLSLLQSGVAGFNGTFPLPSKKQLQWADSINKDYKQYQDINQPLLKPRRVRSSLNKKLKLLQNFKKNILIGM
ncbi:hypothetical protein SMU85_09243, partial [Streptococcus mutans ST6]